MLFTATLPPTVHVRQDLLKCLQLKDAKVMDVNPNWANITYVKETRPTSSRSVEHLEYLITTIATLTVAKQNYLLACEPDGIVSCQRNTHGHRGNARLIEINCPSRGRNVCSKQAAMWCILSLYTPFKKPKTTDERNNISCVNTMLLPNPCIIVHSHLLYICDTQCHTAFRKVWLSIISVFELTTLI